MSTIKSTKSALLFCSHFHNHFEPKPVTKTEVSINSNFPPCVSFLINIIKKFFQKESTLLASGRGDNSDDSDSCT